MKNKILPILGAVLLILNIKMYLDINEINKGLGRVDNHIDWVSNSVNDIKSNVSNTMRKIYNENQWLYNHSCSIKDISKDLENVTFTLKWSLRNLTTGSKVYLLYGEEGEESNEVDKWNEILAEDLENLNYKVNLTLPYKKNYQFKVVAKNNKSMISERLTEIDFLSRLNDRINIHAEPHEKTSADNHVNLGFDVSIENRYNFGYRDKELENLALNIDDNLLKLKNIKIKVYSNDKLKNEFDILKDGKIMDKDAKIQQPFKYAPEDIKIEEISCYKNVEYYSVEESVEKIEVIVEDYMGRTYTKMSHGM
ncbi:hypothetical protein OW763_10160 [Clostridium aestuarii]|uniref:Uncharacterized protein n=1 Tax=Clostridium aestuarii TaxID=338193 RepID=A0ABT4D0E2_9CLOT|nr:hypothetical protein [Clostridium aestuarii]MCY6484704.1 hypothetical protein [Clostridium aestuarii]